MLSFFPGPSKVYPEVQQYLQDAYAQDILSMPHRSAGFEQLSRKTIELLKKKLNIPQDYMVFFTSSATECWEITLQSLVKKQSLHIFNGSFGQKWFEYAQKMGLTALSYPFGFNDTPNPNELPQYKFPDLVCLTHNETSNGTQLPAEFLLHVRSLYPDSIIAVDATSSLGGLHLKINKADIWFASVQKCFGLPAGLGIMLCSPKAVERAKQINNRSHYNSMPVMIDRMLNYQTYNTPNVLAIYLLSRVLEQINLIRTTDKNLKLRNEKLYQELAEFTDFEPLIANTEVRSKTVLAFKAAEKFVSDLRQKALNQNILLGKGYDVWAKNTFRIANFPQHTDADFELLLGFFRKNCR